MHHLTQKSMKRIHIIALAGCGLLALSSCDSPDSTENELRNWKGTPTQQTDSGAVNSTQPAGSVTSSSPIGTPPAGTSGTEVPPEGTNTGAGTETEGATDSGTQETPPATSHTPITFEVPEGWVHSPDSPERALLYQSSADQFTPYYMVEVYRRVGNIDTAKELGKADYQQMIFDCENHCSKPPVYSEKTLAGKQLFVASVLDNSLGHDIWTSSIYFEKNGFVYIIGINSLPEDQEQAITKIIETVQGG